MKLNKLMIAIFAMFLLVGTFASAQIDPTYEDFIITSFTGDSVVLLGEDGNYNIKVMNKGYEPVSLLMTKMVVDFGDGTKVNVDLGAISKNTVKEFALNHKYVTKGNFEVTAKLDFVDNNLETNEAKLSTVVADEISKIELNVDSLVFGDENTERGTNVTQTLIIKNTGTLNLTNVALTFSNTELTNLVKVNSIVPTSIGAGTEVSLTLSVLIPSNLDGGIRFDKGDVKVSASNGSATIEDSAKIYLEAESGLSIDKIDIYVNGEDEDTFKSSEDKYDELKEGDKVKLVIFVENDHSEDIENVYAELSVDGASNWDFVDDEESDEEDIDEGDEFEFEIEFTLDADDLDEDSDDSAEFTLTVRGDDSEEDYEHFDVWTFTLEIDREKDEITLTKVDVSSTTVYCTDSEIQLDVDFKNTGTNDQDEAWIVVKSTGLNYQEEFELEDFDSMDSDDKTFIIPIPSDIKGGTYTIEVSALNEDEDVTDKEIVSITVICSVDEDEDVDDYVAPIVVNPNVPSTPTVLNPVYGEDDFRSSGLYLTLLIILIVLALIGVLLMGALLVKRK
ncbi:MAG: hypothetical protein PHU51_02555 [Candidatus Nanoarchaeia archaeon]|nr:hypothetical protein [Candidatus Nanoarchaeia archaeon]